MENSLCRVCRGHQHRHWRSLCVRTTAFTGWFARRLGGIRRAFPFPSRFTCKSLVQLYNPKWFLLSKWIMQNSAGLCVKEREPNFLPFVSSKLILLVVLFFSRCTRGITHTHAGNRWHNTNLKVLVTVQEDKREKELSVRKRDDHHIISLSIRPDGSIKDMEVYHMGGGEFGGGVPL